MRILVATRETNGSADGDYNWCVEGELVYMQEPCGQDLRDPDRPCGCGRGFAGMSSHRATTTALVVDSPLCEGDVRAALRASLEDGGWINPSLLPKQLADEMVDSALQEMRDVAEFFDAGSVVRRRLSKYAVHFPVE